MLERLDPTLEAAENLGASRLRIFRTVTLPLLIPGIAGSFLLLFVESLADLATPYSSLVTTVLSTQIFIAINGEYDQQKGAACRWCCCADADRLLAATLLGKPAVLCVGDRKPSGRVRRPTGWYIRCPFILTTYGAMVLIVALYLTIVVGSLTRVWGVIMRRLPSL